MSDGSGKSQKADERPYRSTYVNLPASVLAEVDELVATQHLAKGRFVGHLLELGLKAYKDGKRSLS